MEIEKTSHNDDKKTNLKPSKSLEKSAEKDCISFIYFTLANFF